MVSDGPTDHAAEITGRHYDYLQALNQRGVVFMAGRTLDPAQGVFGIVILAAPSAAEARVVMEGDPAVQSGVMLAELFPYRLAWRPTA